MRRKSSTFINGELAWQFNSFSVVREESGALGVLEYAKDFDFNVKRVFFLRNIACGEHRGFHSHKDLKQLVICLHGTFVIKLDNGIEIKEFEMEADNTCLYLDGKVWREMHSFSENAVMVVLCDREYQFDEVIRNYDNFKENIKALEND